MIGTDFRGKFNFKVATINQFLPFGSIFDVQWRIKTKNTNMRFDNCFSGCLRSFMLVIVLEHSSIIRLSTDIYIILQAHAIPYTIAKRSCYDFWCSVNYNIIFSAVLFTSILKINRLTAQTTQNCEITSEGIVVVYIFIASGPGRQVINR